MKKHLPKVINTYQPDTILTIEITQGDLYNMLYRLRHITKEYNVHPDLTKETVLRLEAEAKLDLRYLVDLY